MDNQTDLEVVAQAIPFKIFSGILKASTDDTGKMRLRGIASSTIKDRHGDTMSRSAIADMERAANENLTIFLNHSYNVPEDVAGSVQNAVAIERSQDSDGSPIWDLDFDVVINQANPRAVDAFKAIEAGTKLGLSIGAMIPEGGAVRDKKSGAYIFNHVDLLETSIVGIPANPRSWVQNAVKALKSATAEAPVTFDDLHRAMDSVKAVDEEPDQSGDPDEDAAADAALTTDTDDPQGEPADSQGASPSDPDSGSDDDVHDSAGPNDVSLAATLMETLGSFEATALELVETRRQLVTATEELDVARRERDEIAKGAQTVLESTSQIIQKLANMPVGRKSVIREAGDDLAGLERLYGPEIVKLFRSREENGR